VIGLASQGTHDSVDRFQPYQWPLRREKRPRSPAMVSVQVPPGPTTTASMTGMPPGAIERKQW